MWTTKNFSQKSEEITTNYEFFTVENFNNKNEFALLTKFLHVRGVLPSHSPPTKVKKRR